MNPYTAAPFAAIVALILSTLALYPPHLLAQTPPAGDFTMSPSNPRSGPNPNQSPRRKPKHPKSDERERTNGVVSQRVERSESGGHDRPHNEAKLHRLLALNRYITKQTSATEMTFKKLLAEHPELSYTKDHPTEQSARKVYLAKLKDKHERKVAEMMRLGWGLFFVYDSTDTLAMTLAPSIQQFADRHRLELLGISNDGAFSKDIRENRANHGKLKVKHSPALFGQSQNRTNQTLAYGFIAQCCFAAFTTWPPTLKTPTHEVNVNTFQTHTLGLTASFCFASKYV